MIDKDKVKTLVTANLPQSSIQTIEEIADSITRDVEAVIHSMVRQAVNRERENLYRKNAK